MRKMQGFRSYYLLDDGPGVPITISIFDSVDEAFASNEKAAEWVRNNVLEFTKGMPEETVSNLGVMLRADRDDEPTFRRWHDLVQEYCSPPRIGP
jgi:hypothetical protein